MDDENGRRVANDIEISFTLAEMEEDYNMYVSKPQFASTNSITASAHSMSTGTFYCRITYLGPDLLELRVPGSALSSEIDTDELYYVAVLKNAEKDSDMKFYYGQEDDDQPFEGYHLSSAERAFVAAAYPEYM
ncbi:hypothetical protein PTMSG1_10421 [Pyrenophora teres f. maculata]|nr:hypothetical protein PTMSG1_10421 [Pyrenophora teres f. maculata]